MQTRMVYSDGISNGRENHFRQKSGIQHEKLFFLSATWPPQGNFGSLSRGQLDPMVISLFLFSTRM